MMIGLSGHRTRQKWISSLLLVLLLVSWMPSLSLASEGHHPSVAVEQAEAVPCGGSVEPGAHLASQLPADLCHGGVCIQCSHCFGLVTEMPDRVVHSSQKPSVFLAGLQQGYPQFIERPPKYLS